MSYNEIALWVQDIDSIPSSPHHTIGRALGVITEKEGWITTL